jgi:hypothetical protein
MLRDYHQVKKESKFATTMGDFASRTEGCLDLKTSRKQGDGAFEMFVEGSQDILNVRGYYTNFGLSQSSYAIEKRWRVSCQTILESSCALMQH